MELGLREELRCSRRSAYFSRLCDTVAFLALLLLIHSGIDNGKETLHNAAPTLTCGRHSVVSTPLLSSVYCMLRRRVRGLSLAERQLIEQESADATVPTLGKRKSEEPKRALPDDVLECKICGKTATLEELCLTKPPKTWRWTCTRCFKFRARAPHSLSLTEPEQ